MKTSMPPELPVYTHRTMCEMLEVCRSWTLNNPSGPLPPLPVEWNYQVDAATNVKTAADTMPKFKKTNALLSFLMRIKLLW